MSLLNSIVTSRISRGQRQWLNLVACGHCDPVRSCGNSPRGSDDAALGWLAVAVKTRHLRRRLSSRKNVLVDIAPRSEKSTSELQSLKPISYPVLIFTIKTKLKSNNTTIILNNERNNTK